MLIFSKDNLVLVVDLLGTATLGRKDQLNILQLKCVLVLKKFET